MLRREHICIEIGNPVLALLPDSKVAQGVTDIRSYRLPEEIGDSLIADPRRYCIPVYYSFLSAGINKRSYKDMQPLNRGQMASIECCWCGASHGSG